MTTTDQHVPSSVASTPAVQPTQERDMTTYRVSTSGTEQFLHKDSETALSNYPPPPSTAAVDKTSDPSYDVTFLPIQPQQYNTASPHQHQAPIEVLTGYPHQSPYTQQTGQPLPLPSYSPDIAAPAAQRPQVKVSPINSTTTLNRGDYTKIIPGLNKLR